MRANEITAVGEVNYENRISLTPSPPSTTIPGGIMEIIKELISRRGVIINLI